MRFGGDPFGDPEVKETALLIAPRLYGYGVGQISFLISSRTLAALGNAYVTFNYCAFRVVDLVLGGFVVSLTRAILPSLSEQAHEEGQGRFRETLSLSLRLVGFVTIPSTVGLLLLARPVIDVIFRRGRFEARDVDADGARGRLLRARPLRGGGREDPDAGLLRAPRHADAGRRRDVRPRGLLAPLRRARRAHEARRGRPRDVGRLLGELRAPPLLPSAEDRRARPHARRRLGRAHRVQRRS